MPAAPGIGRFTRSWGGTPGPSEAIPDGLCRPCRQAPREAAPAATEPAVERNIQAHMKSLRDALTLP